MIRIKAEFPIGNSALTYVFIKEYRCYEQSLHVILLTSLAS